jgi:hypothetical protein
MVPQRQALEAIALAALSTASPMETLNTLLSIYVLKFPCDFETFCKNNVQSKLTGDVFTRLKAADEVAAIEAARELGVEYAIQPGGLNIPPSIAKWRQHKSIRIFLETCLLCGISELIIADDLRKLYGLEFREDDIVMFKKLFVDITYATGNAWLDYTTIIGAEESLFKRRLMDEPRDFVRWKLGVPITLNADTVLSRLVSDAYYTERVIKLENAVLGKDEIARIKMERDTIFKAMDRLSKFKEANGIGGAATEAVKEIKRIIVDLGNPAFPTQAELEREDEPDQN